MQQVPGDARERLLLDFNSCPSRWFLNFNLRSLQSRSHWSVPLRHTSAALASFLFFPFMISFHFEGFLSRVLSQVRIWSPEPSSEPWSTARTFHVHTSVNSAKFPPRVSLPCGWLVLLCLSHQGFLSSLIFKRFCCRTDTQTHHHATATNADPAHALMYECPNAWIPAFLVPVGSPFSVTSIICIFWSLS